MADSLSSLIYVKNYRADRLRLQKKYSNSSVDNIWASSSTLTGTTFDRPSSSSFLRSNLNLTYVPNPVRSSSGYSSNTDFSSSWSPKVSLVSAVKLAGFGGQLGSRASSYIDFGGGPRASPGAGIEAQYSSRSRPPVTYHRTLSGGAQFRSTSADPDFTAFRSPIVQRSRGPEPDWTNRSASVERHYEQSLSSLVSNSGIQSSFGLNGSSSSMVTSVEQAPSERRTWITPVTELARNVSAYDWDKEKSVASLFKEASPVSESIADLSHNSKPAKPGPEEGAASELVTLTSQNGIEQVYSKRRNPKEICFLEPEDELTLARVSEIIKDMAHGPYVHDADNITSVKDVAQRIELKLRIENRR